MPDPLAGRRFAHHRNVADTTTWLTPLSIIDELGPFDFDPCGLAHWPTATTINEWPSDGLALEWPMQARIWLNPPYGTETWTWLNRLADHPGGGIALVFARTETAGFRQAVWRRADGLLFVHKRIRFHRGDGTAGEAYAGAPSCLVSYGDRDTARLRDANIAGAFMSDWRLR